MKWIIDPFKHVDFPPEYPEVFGRFLFGRLYAFGPIVVSLYTVKNDSGEHDAFWR